MEFLTLLPSLILSILEAGVNAPPLLLLSRQLHSQLLVLLIYCNQGLASLGVKIGLNPSFIAGISHPLLSHEYLLVGLYKNNRGIRYRIRKN